MHQSIKAFILWGFLASITGLLILVFVLYPRMVITPVVFEEELFNQQVGEKTSSQYTDLITVSSPSPGELVESPLTVIGEARGWWYFEATFPIELQSENGEVLGEGYAKAQDDWMTESFVPFEAEISFLLPEENAPESGVLILHRENPSDLPEHDASISIPVRFVE